MKLDKKYKLDKIYTSKSTMRPVMANFALDRNASGDGVAIATNGYSMAVVPADVEPGDVLGVACAPLVELKKARFFASQKTEPFRMQCIGMADSCFPNWKNITADYSQVQAVQIKFNVEFLAALASALGGKEVVLTCYDQRKGDCTPFTVRVKESPDALGYLMPMKMG